jgi:SAM-dependent MidA family methyltransferase
MRRNDTPTHEQREPGLDAAQRQHLARVREFLTRQIAGGGGFMGFERFMDLALYAPGLGYYSGGAHKLGRDGDFITAPELSGLFGRCVAKQCAEVFAAIGAAGRGAEALPTCIMEVGAGSGRLAVDVLRRLEQQGALPDRYWILEVSADLIERQRQLIGACVPHLLPRVAWLERPPRDGFEGVILANEVLDALPVARFRWSRAAVEEIGVVLEASASSGFAWDARPADKLLSRACETLHGGGGDWDDGYVSEYCPRAVAFTAAVSGALRRGAVLWFDYGLPRSQYYLPERHEGTLISHFRHHAHPDVLRYPGLQDITAWVDFTLLAEASRETGFELAGFTTQAHFLAASGIDEEMHAAAAGDENAFARLAQQARQLMLPGEMGERFKAMAWLRGIDCELRGFALQDFRHAL